MADPALTVEDAPATSGVYARPSVIPETLTRAVPAWVVIAFLIVAGGGSTASALIGRATAPPTSSALVEDVSRAEFDVLADDVADLEAGRGQHTQDIAELRAEVKSAEARLLREQIKMTRWVVDALVLQAGALEAIAGELDVEVDVRMPMYPVLDDEGAGP
jgi:outer membrane murein-binding lipoprotein Lpp